MEYIGFQILHFGRLEGGDGSSGLQGICNPRRPRDGHAGYKPAQSCGKKPLHAHRGFAIPVGQGGHAGYKPAQSGGKKPIHAHRGFAIPVGQGGHADYKPAQSCGEKTK